MSEKNTEIHNASAIRDKRNPPCLTLNGKVIIYSSNGNAKFIEADPQGINENILVVDIIVNEGNGPMKGILSPIKTFEKCDFEVQKYQQVTMRYQGREKTIDISG